MKRTYSQEEKERALAKCAEIGAYDASKALGIPRSTLAFWMKEAGLHWTDNQEKVESANEARALRIAAKRALLQERMLEEAAYCMEAIHNEHIDFKSAGKEGVVKVVFPTAPAAAVQHYATSLAIFIDKFRLENGESTSRSEVQVDDIDSARGVLTQQLTRISERRGTNGDTGESDTEAVPGS